MGILRVCDIGNNSYQEPTVVEKLLVRTLTLPTGRNERSCFCKGNINSVQPKCHLRSCDVEVVVEARLTNVHLAWIPSRAGRSPCDEEDT